MTKDVSKWTVDEAMQFAKAYYRLDMPMSMFVDECLRYDELCDECREHFVPGTKYGLEEKENEAPF